MPVAISTQLHVHPDSFAVVCAEIPHALEIQACVMVLASLQQAAGARVLPTFCEYIWLAAGVLPLAASRPIQHKFQNLQYCKCCQSHVSAAGRQAIT